MAFDFASLGKLAKDLGPEAFGQLSSAAPDILSSVVKGKKEASKGEKFDAVSTAMQNMLAPPQDGGPPKQSSGIDKLQMGLDIAGIIDPTPITDSVNGIISLARAATAKTGEERSEHLKNAAISAISGWLPYAGDVAKIGKLTGKGAAAAEKTVGKAAAKETSVGLDTVVGGAGGMAGAAPPPINPLGAAPDLSSVHTPVHIPPGSIPSPPHVHPKTPAQSPNALARVPPPGPGFAPAVPGAPPVAPPAPVPHGPEPIGTTPPPPPTGTAPLSAPPPPTGPLIPPHPTSGPTSAPPHPPPSSGGGWESLLAGAAAGATHAMLFDSDAGAYFGRPTAPKKYSMATEIAGEGGQAAADIGGIWKQRIWEEAMNPVSHPIEFAMNPMGGLVKSITGMAKYVDEMPAALMKWADSLTESQRHLQQWSGTLANAFQESQIRQQMRDIRSAGNTAGSTVDLRRALDDLKDELQPFGNLFTNASNRIVEVGTQVVTWITAAVTDAKVFGVSLDNLTEAINKWLGGGGKNVDTAVVDLMKELRGLKFPDRLTKPPKKP